MSGGSFEPGPPTPSENRQGGRRSRYPYTALYVAGLKMGLTASDLHLMPLPRLLFMVGELADMNAPDDSPREATQADIAEFLL